MGVFICTYAVAYACVCACACVCVCVQVCVREYVSEQECAGVSGKEVKYRKDTKLQSSTVILVINTFYSLYDLSE